MGQANSSSHWAMPRCQPNQDNVISWEATTFPLNERPPNFQSYHDPDSDEFKKMLKDEIKTEKSRKYQDIVGLYHTAQSESNKLARPVQAGDMEPWLWTCRIYFRTLDRDYAGADGFGARKNDAVPSAWGFATAYLVHDAHQGDSKSQWLLTAAHNLVHVVPWTCSSNGIVLDPVKPSITVADAILVAVGWGENIKLGWVDRAAVMSNYFTLDYGLMKKQRFDGAALHIKDSMIPSHFWERAPSLGTVIPTTKQRDIVFVCPGFPGAHNTFTKLAGLYIGGKHGGAGGYGYRDFAPVTISIAPIVPEKEKPKTGGNQDEEGGFQGCLFWNSEDCFIASGQSGSPCVVFINETEVYIVGTINTDGVAAPLSARGKGELSVAVDPVALLRAVGLPEVSFAKLLKVVRGAQ